MKTHRPPNELKKFQHRMRRWQSEPEAQFAFRLTNLGVTFKTQVILGFYIVDFILPAQMLCVEIDGPEHKSRKLYDRARDAFIESAGFRIIRIPNADVKTYPLDFLDTLPRFPETAFARGCSKAMSRKGVVLLGRSNLPTLGQRSLGL